MKKISSYQADMALIFVAAIWGTTFVAVKDALADLAPHNFLAIRFSIAFIVLLLPGLFTGYPWQKRAVGVGIGVGIILFFGYALQTVGLKYTSAANAAFITGLSVVLIPLLSALGLRQMPSWSAACGAVTAAVGLGFLTLGEGFLLNRGDLLVLGCAFAFATHIILVNRYAKAHSAYDLAVGQMLGVAVVSWLFTLLWENPTFQATPRTWAAILITAILASAVAFFLQTTMQQFTTPTRTGIIFATEPVFAALFAYWWLGERLTTGEMIGCALILGGMLVAELGGKKGLESGEVLQAQNLEDLA
ncbi:MAG: DMT family transporter [Limnochordia bacterium]|jgi:drug/metabolite transporter (DMT)-like permease